MEAEHEQETGTGSERGHGDRADEVGGREDATERAEGDAGNAVSQEAVAEDAPRTEQQQRPLVVEYAIALVFPCPHCKQLVVDAGPNAIQAGLANSSMSGPCPKCKGPLNLRPRQTFIAVPQGGENMATARNRHEKRQLLSLAKR